MGTAKPIPNTLLSQARRRLTSPSGSGRPMSRRELADAVNHYLWEKHSVEKALDETDIGRLERGENRWPRKLRREAFRSVLQVGTDAEIGFYIARASAATARTASSSWHVAEKTRSGRVDEPTERRGVLLGGVAMIVAASGLFDSVELMARRRVGVADLDRLNCITALYRSMDYEYGGGALVTDVGRFAEAASAVLDLEYSDSVADPLHSSIAAARQLAGWVAFDAGRHSDAQRHLVSAERQAVAGGNVMLAARIRYCQARQLQHLRHNRDALDTLRLARDHLGSAATPAVSAMLHGAEAASRAALGQADLALAGLHNARREFDRIDPSREPDWMGFYDYGELLAQYGRVYRDMARNDARHGSDAVRWVVEAIAAFGPQHTRSVVLNEVGLCSALLLANEPDEALRVGRRLQEEAKRVSSQRVVDRIANLRRDLARYRGHSDINDFVRSLPQPAVGAA